MVIIGISLSLPLTGEIVADVSSSDLMSPGEPASPFVKSSAANSRTFSSSPMSPVHTLINSPYIVSKVGLSIREQAFFFVDC